jgi:hypothetical protein
MRRPLLLPAVMLLVVASVAQQPRGIKPRSAPESYPAVSIQPSLTVGALRLSNSEIRKTFVANLSKKYIVLEVGAFPKSEVLLSPQDFLLVVREQKDEIRAADPDTMAGQLAKEEAKGNKDVTVSPVVGVTYGSGNDPYGPSYGGRGWGTTTGVAVQHGSGGQRDPKTIEADRKTMATELKDKQLPDGSTAKPVAGYVYFPIPENNRKVTLALEYRGPTGNFTIPLPPVSR